MTPEDPIAEEAQTITSHQFFFETGLYEPINIELLEDGIFSCDIDAYSPSNQIDTTYEVSTSLRKSGQYLVSRQDYVTKQNGYFQVSLDCKRKGNERLMFFLHVNGPVVTKVGQFPSIADIQCSEIGKRYDKVLDKENLNLLKKAIGLFAHGAGAGSFVYLRRIFEGLLLEVFKENEKKLDIKETDFQFKRMEEKIDLLREYLPVLLIRHKAIYGVLSKGVHQLSEKDCLSHFKTIKGAIELILTQRAEERRKKEEEERIAKEMGDVYQLVK